MLRFHCLLSLHVMIGNCFLGDLLAAALGSATHSSVGTTVRTSCLMKRTSGESRGEGVGFDEGVDVRGIGDGD
jgi:hypothetical protein